MDTKRLAVAASLCLAAIGCASAPQPTDRLVAAESAMRAAKEVGVSDVPQAQLHSQLAEEQYAKARHLIADGDNERAGRLLQRATADAELALAMARQAKAEREAQQAEAHVKNTSEQASASGQ